MNKKTTSKKASVRQKAALTNLVANGGNVAKAMRDAGYSPATARTPKKLLGASSISSEILIIAELLKEERKRALSNLSKKIKDAKYGDLVDATYKITKTLNLIEGKPTEKIEVALGDERKADLYRILLGE